MATENPSWGEGRIANELKLKLGYRVVKTSVLGGLYHEYRLVKEAA
jgi:hypothetical protein